MTKRKLRPSIAIGGVTIMIKWGKPDAGEWASYESGVSTITIREDCADDKIGQYLFHEAIHAALDVSGLRNLLSAKMEEAVVCCVENLLWPLVTWRKDV